MAPTSKADNPHVGGNGRRDPRDAVLDYDAAAQLNAHLRRSMEKKIGKRLAASDRAGAENVRMEALKQSRFFEG
jgi:hypothetical protein